jgi:choline dehydrogenase-like flavoprotein
MRGPVELDTDVVIVGSGASGSVVAARLAAAGWRTLVVEEGEHVEPERYQKMRPSESMASLWREGGMGAAVGLGDTPVINVTMGSCVGGSSVLTGGVCFRTPSFVLREWVDEHGLDDLAPERMAPYFEEVERRVHVEEVPVQMRSRSTELWAAGAAKRGVEVKPTQRNTSGCVGWGRCNFGCPEGAKLSVDVSYLPDAVADGARVLSDCLVEEILVEGVRAVGVRGRLRNGPGGKPGDAITIHARRVVLAAGAVHTPLLLMRCGIGRQSGQVGRNLTLHPAFRMMARFDQKVRGWQGALQSAYADAFEHEDIMLISVYVPPFAVASGLPGFGPAFVERAEHLDHLAMFGGLIHDDGSGRVIPNPLDREPIMLYQMSRKDRARIPKLVRELGESFLAAGARELYTPVLGHDPVDADGFRAMDLDHIPARRFECSSQHPLGTCRMGTSAARAVVDPNGKTWDVDELYVVDGSTIPTSLGVNPQMTIMTMATRFADRILDAPLPD